jgi:hypothetical protein
MKRPTDDQILTALCCGPKCKVGPNTGYCHRWDFPTELTRVRALLDNMGNGHDRDQDRVRQRSDEGDAIVTYKGAKQAQ